MARWMNLGNQTDLKWIFNVSEPVGPGLANRPDDVMLLQHLFNTVMPSLDLKDDAGEGIAGYFVRNGKFDPRLFAVIKAYQRNLKARGRVVTVDGRMDPSNTEGWTTRTNNQYTIVHLNRDHLKIQGKMPDEADFPAPLREAVGRNSKG